MCDSWIKEKIAAFKATPPFPLEAKSYITWITQFNKAELNTTPNMLWRIHVVNLHQEGKFFLKMYYQSPTSIGLCILDGTEDFATSMEWN